MKKYLIEDVLKLIPNSFKNNEPYYILLDKYKINVNKKRYQDFKNNGVKCKVCGIEGQFFILNKIDYEKDKAVLDLYGIKDGENIIVSSVSKKAFRPKFKVGTILCSDCIHTFIAHNKSNGFKNRKNEYEKYKKENNCEDKNLPFKELLKDFHIE